MRKSITISNQLNTAIKEYCSKNGISNSQLIETAVQSYLTLYNLRVAITEEKIKSHKIQDAIKPTKKA